MRPRGIVVIAAALFSLRSAAQQSPAIPRAGETIDVSIVNVDVFVTDKKGARIRGLTKADFEVFENGVSQPISNFAEYADGQPANLKIAGADSALAVPAFVRGAAAQPRTMIVFIDRFHVSKLHADSFFGAMKDLLHKTVRPGDAAMIVTWSYGVLKTRQSFTDDLVPLDRAIDQIAAQTSGASVDEFSQAKEEADAAREFELQSGVSDSNWSASMNALGRAKKARFEERQKIENLEALIRSVSADEGRKLLVLATHRLSRIAGAEFLFAGGSTAIETGQYTGELTAEADLKSLYETANANGVTIYSMYPEGLLRAIDDASVKGYDRFTSATGGSTAPGETSDMTQFLISSNETSALEEIAQHTGGMSASGPDSARLLPRIEDDLQNYYSLAYRARSTRPDRARNIVVKLKNPDLVARSRREAIDKSDVTRMEDRVISALFRPPAPPSFAVVVALGQARAHGKMLTIPITVRIPIAALTTLPEAGTYAGAFSIYLAWGTRFHRVSETKHDTRSFRIPMNDIIAARHSYYSYVFDLIADAQTERVSLGVLDEVSKEYALKIVNLRR